MAFNLKYNNVWDLLNKIEIQLNVVCYLYNLDEETRGEWKVEDICGKDPYP